MAGCLDNFQFPTCEGFNMGERRNKFAAIVSGVFVSVYSFNINIFAFSDGAKFPAQ